MVGQAQPEQECGEIERAHAAARSPRHQREQDRDDERRVERVDLGDDGLRPEGGRDGEDRGRQERQQPADRGRPAGRGSHLEHPQRQQIEQADRDRSPQRRESVHPPGGIAERQQVRPEIAEEQIERVAGGMRKAAEPRRELELAAVAAEHAGREGAEVERGGERRDGQSKQIVDKPESGRMGEWERVSSPAPPLPRSPAPLLRQRHGPSSTQSSAAASVRKSPATRTKASPGLISSAAVPGAAPWTPTSAWDCPARSAGDAAA